MQFRHLILAGALASVPSLASAVTIDFDALPSDPLQPFPLTSITEDGFSFDVSFSGPAAGVALFDTTCTGAACNGDTDLKPATQGENGIEGNILILQEGGSNVPDDDGSPGTITLTLTEGSDFRFTGGSAIDDVVIGFGTSIDGLLAEVDNGPLNSATGSVTFLSSILTVGDSITLDYSGSGGVDSLLIQPVPLPAALSLLATGIGGLAFAARRRRARGPAAAQG